MTAESAREQLFRAIGEGRFARVTAIAAEYRECVVRSIRSVDRPCSKEQLEQALRPLEDSLRYLRIVRAQQSVRFQKLSTDALYRRYLSVSS